MSDRYPDTPAGVTVALAITALMLIGAATWGLPWSLLALGAACLWARVALTRARRLGEGSVGSGGADG